MAEVVHDAHQEFWRPPSVLAPPTESDFPAKGQQEMAETCGGCSTEFMIGARFCHSCGRRRPQLTRGPISDGTDAAIVAKLWIGNMAWARTAASAIVAACREVPIPEWLRYLHFHEIKRWVGLPTAALIAFMVGLGCVTGAISVGLFYKASNLAEFQAIQMWRIEWLLAATASFVAGILLKKPSGIDKD
jgi:hypothetical protein